MFCVAIIEVIKWQASKCTTLLVLGFKRTTIVVFSMSVEGNISAHDFNSGIDRKMGPSILGIHLWSTYTEPTYSLGLLCRHIIN